MSPLLRQKQILSFWEFTYSSLFEEVALALAILALASFRDASANVDVATQEKLTALVALLAILRTKDLARKLETH